MVHLANPVSVLTSIAALAHEAVIVTMTPALKTDQVLMRTASDWTKKNRRMAGLSFPKGYTNGSSTTWELTFRLARPQKLKNGKHVNRYTIIETRRN